MLDDKLLPGKRVIVRPNTSLEYEKYWFKVFCLGEIVSTTKGVIAKDCTWTDNNQKQHNISIPLLLLWRIADNESLLELLFNSFYNSFLLKTRISNTNISAYGGALPVYKLIEKFGIKSMIQYSLGNRPAQSKYQYNDVLIAWLMTNLCREYRLIKIENSKKNLSLIPGLKICSHDTVGRVLKKLATENINVNSSVRVDKSHPPKPFIINENDKLNDLLIRITKGVGLLEENTSYTLDVDATLIPSETYEAKPMYKGGSGYMPMVCMIDKMPVYISMRSGNASPATMQKDCIEKCIKQLKKHNIKIGRVRLDGDGYGIETTTFLNSMNIKFVIGADSMDRTFNLLKEITNWKKSNI